MKTAIQSGKILELTAPTGGVVSGTPYLIGSLLVVAADTVAQTLPFRGLAVGVVTGPKLEGEAWDEGEKIYWDDTAKKFTSVSSGNTLVGVAALAEPLTIVLASDADPGDLLVDGLTLQVLAFASLSGAVVTVTIDGVDTELTEGVDWDAETSNDVTATNLAAAINALTGVDAAAVTDTVTVTPGEQALTGRVRLDGVAR